MHARKTKSRWRAWSAGLLAAVAFPACARTAPTMAAGACAVDADCGPGERCGADRVCRTDPGAPPDAENATPDVGGPPDLATPPAAPAAIWLGGSGGSSTEDGTQLNLSVGGSSFIGESRGDDGRYINFGPLFLDTL